MHEPRPQNIREYLQRRDVQERIWKDIQEARSKATVTISRAASLFNFKESQLREWERRGLLQTERSVLSQEGKEGHRQYSPSELDKLAVIRELLNKGFTSAEIPSNVYKLWTQAAGAGTEIDRRKEEALPIDKREEETDRQGFWRYFVSQALRISLMLICEGIDDSMAGLILPLEDREGSSEIQLPADLSRVGPSLVGWLGRNRSFYTFLDEAPDFQFPSDYRLIKLATPPEEHLEGTRILDNVYIILQREARPLVIDPELIKVVYRILKLIWARIESWQPVFEHGAHDWFYQAHDLDHASRVRGDFVFNSLLERIIELGGRTSDGGDRWKFCTLLLPRDTSLPLQQQVLVVRAQTRFSDYEIGVASSDPNQRGKSDSLSLKAFQSGQIVYFPETLPGQNMIDFQLPVAVGGGGTPFLSDDIVEKTTRSALALPITRESEISSAVLYVASEETHAFSPEDQRILRIISRMIEELLFSSQVRRQVTRKLDNIISSPLVVDRTFQDFATETDFVEDVNRILTGIQKEKERGGELNDMLTIVAADLYNQSSVATKHGNSIARNLSREMGLRIKSQMRLSSKYTASKLFHVSADKYILFVPISLDEACKLARDLKEALQGDYRIKSPYAVSGRVMLPQDMLDIANIKVHLGVSSYRFEKLAEMLARYPATSAVTNVCALIAAGIEEMLEKGRFLRGDCIFAWDDAAHSYTRLD